MEEVGDAESEAEEYAEYTGPVQEAWSVRIQCSSDSRNAGFCHAKVKGTLPHQATELCYRKYGPLTINTWKKYGRQHSRKLENMTANSLKLRDLNSSASVIVTLYDYPYPPCRCLDYPMLGLPQAGAVCCCAARLEARNNARN